jgi:hypothetical protein
MTQLTEPLGSPVPKLKSHKFYKEFENKREEKSLSYIRLGSVERVK